jgi:hypothetical protein
VEIDPPPASAEYAKHPHDPSSSSLRSDLGGIADPQLHLQLGQQSFKPPRLPARFHP